MSTEFNTILPDREANKVYIYNRNEKRIKGRPQKRWIDATENDLRMLYIRQWKGKSQDKELWRKIAKAARDI